MSEVKKMAMAKARMSDKALEGAGAAVFMTALESCIHQLGRQGHIYDWTTAQIDLTPVMEPAMGLPLFQHQLTVNVGIKEVEIGN